MCVHSGGKAEEAAREKREGAKQPSRVDYLSIDRNVAANQLTVTSIASGNLALYEVRVFYYVDKLQLHCLLAMYSDPILNLVFWKRGAWRGREREMFDGFSPLIDDL